MKKYGLIGYSLKHSFSKKYFTQKFENEKIDAVYDLYEITKIEEFENLKNNTDFSGLNVTIPYKEKIIPYLDKLDKVAQDVGAVNTIKFIKKQDKTVLKGYNTDVFGFVKSIEPHLKEWHKKALILGTGGAGKAIDYGLKTLGIKTKFVSRKPTEKQFSYTDIDASILDEYKIIINTSPVGMYPKVGKYPCLPYHFLGREHLLFDAIYNPQETLFLRKGKEQKAQTLNGMEMLINQAEKAWKIWNIE